MENLVIFEAHSKVLEDNIYLFVFKIGFLAIESFPHSCSRNQTFLKKMQISILFY